MGWRRDSHAPGQRSRMLQGSRRQANKQSRHQHQQVLLKGQGLPLVGGQASQQDNTLSWRELDPGRARTCGHNHTYVNTRILSFPSTFCCHPV